MQMRLHREFAGDFANAAQLLAGADGLVHLNQDVRRKSRIGHHIFAAGHLDNISPHRVVAHGSDGAVAGCPDRFSGFCADVDAVVGAPVAQCFIFHQHISAEWGDGSTTDRQLKRKAGGRLRLARFGAGL